jgi:tetraprenyl-beta-curcumene synthase
MSPLTNSTRCNTRTVTVVIGSYLSAIFPLARRELWRWQRRAASIHDPTLRAHALETLDAEHMNAEGAALFAVLAPPRWRIAVARALVAYQTMYDYLDTLTELPDGRDPASCVQLHRALDDALRPGDPVSDWYGLHPQTEEGYLSALVAACRAGLAPLPSYAVVQPAALDSARRATEVQTLNHRPASRRDRGSGLRAWGERAVGCDDQLTWWEHAAGACSTLDLHMLLALAGEPDLTPADLDPAIRHGTALSALNTILESLVDLPADRRSGDHSYVSYYGSPGEAAERLRVLTAETIERSRLLRRPAHHLAIAQAMSSMYLSRAEARSAEARPVARTVRKELPQPTPGLIAVQRMVRALRRLEPRGATALPT